MKVTADGREYRVRWKHVRSNNGPVRASTLLKIQPGMLKCLGGDPLVRAVTHCLIEPRPSEENNSPSNPILWSFALCSAKDAFCRDTGRRVSMTGALGGIKTKTFRRAFWQAYDDQIGLHREGRP